MADKLKSAAHRTSLEACWKVDLDWNLYPKKLVDGCNQIGKAISVPATAVLGGLMFICGYFLAHSIVEVPGTSWCEPVVLWLSIGMPTGSCKSSLFKLLVQLVADTRKRCKLDDRNPAWTFDEATFEKMGALMAENGGRLLGTFDELTSFLTQINLYKSRGLTDSHDLSAFLQLYNGHGWCRKTVTGDANFSMEKTALTVGGFTQPSVARNLWDQQASIEKGLPQRFLWLIPQPYFSTFDSLEPIDEAFYDSLVTLFSNLWKSGGGEDANLQVLQLPSGCKSFKEMFDTLQSYLKKLCGHDDFVTGILSKQKGQALRVAAVMNALFSLDDKYKLKSLIDEDAVKAAINFVQVCGDHASLLSGRRRLAEVVAAMDMSKSSMEESQVDAAAAYCLQLPGTKLSLTPLLNAKKFRSWGNKEGAVNAFRRLANEGLGEVEEIKGKRGTKVQYVFHKRPIPDDEEGKQQLCQKLQKFDVSIAAYDTSIHEPEDPVSIMSPPTDSDDSFIGVRRSPRKHGTQTAFQDTP